MSSNKGPEGSAGGSIWNSPLWDKQAVQPLLGQLEHVRSDMLELEGRAESLLRDVVPRRQASARNLLHYIALRRHDIRELQEQLVPRGLSSLGRCESYVLANVETVLRLLCELTSAQVEPLEEDRLPVDFPRGRALLARGAEELLGPQEGDDELRIMVTMPSQGAEDYLLVRDLLEAGMGVMRINCAHDDRVAWAAMIANLRRAESEVDRRCRVAMDLAGPKIRTGPIEPGPRVTCCRPHRDAFGRVVAPCRIWLSSTTPPQPGAVHADAVVPLKDDWWRDVEPGSLLRFRDAAGRRRQWTVLQRTPAGLWVEARQTTYVTPETIVRVVAPGEDGRLVERGGGRFGSIAPRENFIVLRRGDRLVVTRPEVPGRPARYDEQGRLVHAASIGCTLPEIFADVQRGDRVLFDDGKIAGVVEEASATQLIVEITRARPQGQKLREDKGINLPDTDLQLPALTPKDLDDLAFVVQHADIVNYSFVRRAEDVQRLLDELSGLGRPDLGIVLKIENKQAFNNLPRLLLEVMRSGAAGVMIARGDLAVECGWERLAEMQEEILWMCEAAHLPVIWATQVLEGLAKKGLPTRAEVTDAAMGARAECVMLNKGPNIVETVRSLHEILHRMQAHQQKKRPTFRRLRIAENLWKESR